MHNENKIFGEVRPGPLEFTKPKIPALLPDIENGQRNLLPITAQSEPLRLNLGGWADGGHTSTVSILLDGSVVPGADKDIPAGAEDDERFTLLPQKFFNADGVYSISYHVHNLLGDGGSFAQEFEVDLTPPQLAVASAPLFPQTEITERYLEEHENQVIVTVPDYVEIWAGDTVYYSLSRDAGAPNIIGHKTWSREEIAAPPLTYIIKSEDFIKLGDGEHYALYSITDRAGNVSANSLITTLNVTATPKPRWLPHPVLNEATGAGNNQTINPKFVNGDLTLTIPEEAVIKEGDILMALWGEPGTAGAEQTLPDSDITEFTIPFKWFPAQIGKTITVKYQVINGDKVVAESDDLLLTVEKITQGEFGAISCTEPVLSGLNMKLSEAFTKGGARFAIEDWPFMAAGHRFNVHVNGINNNNEPLTTVLLNNHKVTQPEVDQEYVGKQLEYKELSLYGLNQKFYVETKISYDDGETWIPFGTLNINLVV